MLTHAAALVFCLVTPLRPATFAVPPILMYHRVDPMPGDSALSRLLTVSPQQFAAEMYYLQEHGVRAISISEMEAALARHENLRSTVVLTFDDGYEDQYAYALPSLLRFGSQATFFIVTGEVDRPRHVTWWELAQMAREHMDVAAHGVQHDDLSRMTPQQQAYQIDSSIAQLQEHLREPVSSYAYPSGRFNATTLKLVQASGVQLAVTTDPTYVLPPETRFEVTRLRVRGDWSISDFAAAVHAALTRRQVVER